MVLLSLLYSLIIDCGSPNSIRNGSINLDVSDMTTLQSTATVTCELGFDSSTESVACLANGTWEYASCIIKGQFRNTLCKCISYVKCTYPENVKETK